MNVEWDGQWELGDAMNAVLIECGFDGHLGLKVVLGTNTN
jgi:hypothetical protein